MDNQFTTDPPCAQARFLKKFAFLFFAAMGTLAIVSLAQGNQVYLNTSSTVV